MTHRTGSVEFFIFHCRRPTCAYLPARRRGKSASSFLSAHRQFSDPFGRFSCLALPLTSSADTPSLLPTRCLNPTLCRSRCDWVSPLSDFEIGNSVTAWERFLSALEMTGLGRLSSGTGSETLPNSTASGGSGVWQRVSAYVKEIGYPKRF